ncbi:MAG: type VI secretion system-associated FHA domain protein TagH, partial [Rhodopila sp.]
PEYTIGRGPSGVNWVLSDVNQLVSRWHCTVAFRSGAWLVIDKSVNGTFSNHDEDPIGKDNERTLRNHDRIRIGPYEIEVHLAENEAAGQGYLDTTRGNSFVDDPFADPLAVGLGNPVADPLWGSDPALGSFRGRTQDDHASALNEAMRPPNPVGQVPLHTGGTIPGDELLPDDWDSDLLADLSGSTLAGGKPAPPEPPAPVAVVAPAPVAVVAPAPAAVVAPAPAGIAPTPAVQPPSERPVAPPETASTAFDSTLLAAFLAGAGLPDAKPGDPEATMQRLGETYRALVAGLRSVLIARAAVKSEFRIEQTMIRARGNNPLKFSANDDDAVSALLGVGRHTEMAPAKAVTDALRDIRLHELASVAAMQSAVRALLAGLDPDRVRAAAEHAGGRSVLLPAQRKARAWETYEALYARIAQALSDDFDSVFGKAFARAYEEAFDDLAAEDRP